MGRGVLFALTAEEDELISEADTDEEVMAIVEQIEERWEQPWLEELDKAWDALHRCLSDGTLTEDGGDYPLSFAILGSEPIYDGDDYIVRYVAAEEVVEVAAALQPLDEQWLRERYRSLHFVDYEGFLGEEDLAYTVANFADLQSFYQRAAAAGRAVIFTVDQ